MKSKIASHFTRWGFVLLLMATFCLVSFPRLTTAPVLSASPPSLTVEASNPQALLQQGRALYESGQLSAAAAILQQAVQGYRNQGNALGQAMTLSNLALVYEQLGAWGEANQAIAQSLEILQTRQNLEEDKRLSLLAQTLEIQGRLQLAQGQAEAALATWEQATALYKQQGKDIDAAQTQIRQAQALQILGFHQQAIALLEPLGETLKTLPDSPTKAMGLRTLGDTYLTIGNLNNARQVTQDSLDVAARLQLPDAIASAQLSLGNIARAQQDIDTALACYQQVATGTDSPTTPLQAQLNQSSLLETDESPQASALLSPGQSQIRAFPDNGIRDTATGCSQQIATGNGSPTTRLQAQLNQLSLLVEGNKVSQAAPLLPQIQSQIGALPPSRTTVYAQINFARSLMRLRKMKAPTAPSWDEIAQGLIAAREQAKALGDQRAEAYALGHLGEVYEQHEQWQEAQTITEQALVLSQNIDANDMTYRWHWQMGRLQEAQGKTEAAIASYTSAVNILQSLRSDLASVNREVQFSFQESIEPIHRELVSLLLNADGGKSSPQKLEKALNVIEALQIAELNNFLREACLEARPVAIDKIPEVQNVALIYPVILPDRLEIIIKLPGQELRHTPNSKTSQEVEQMADELRGALYNRISLKFRPLTQQVYDLLIRPIETDLANSKVETLVFVLDGALRNIPMAALNDGQQYLIEKYAIALTPGLQLVSPKSLQERSLSAIAVGITEARQEFSELPNVETELQQIQATIPTITLLNQNFTIKDFEEALRSTSAPIVHLATHGQFSSEQERTFILTWDDKLNVGQINALLQANDLRRSEPIELLVLSACETASGDKRAALGLAGVAVRAGARSTIASLWQVDDAATAQLMARFYEELASQKLTKAEALRQAQLSILKNPQFRGHPYFWAPFILLGNWL